MAPISDFGTFLRAVRSGDAVAAEELVRRYERAVRVVVRIRLTDPDMRRQFDSLDVCQSVLASFFARAAGQYDLHEPRQLVALLARMAEHKLFRRVRYHRRECRDSRRTVGGEQLDSVPADQPGPEQYAAGRDLLATVRARLTADELALADRRAFGQTWPEIAADLGGTAQARRRQLTRALDRIAPELGLDGPTGGDDE